MVQLLRGVCYVHLFAGFIGMFVSFVNDEKIAALGWLLGGAIGAVLFYALSLIMAYVEDMSARIREIEREVFKDSHRSSPPKLGTSKASIDKLKDFKI